MFYLFDAHCPYGVHEVGYVCIVVMFSVVYLVGQRGPFLRGSNIA